MALTILVAVSAALVGTAGYLSAQMQSKENDARALGLARLNEANAIGITANQLMYLDLQLHYQAIEASFDTHYEKARFLRSSMQAVQLGYFNLDGEPAAAYGGNHTKAWQDFYTYIYGYYGYYEKKSNSNAALAEAQHASGKALDFMFSIVLLAIAAMLGTVGMSARTRSLRFILLVLGVVFVASSCSLMAFAWVR